MSEVEAAEPEAMADEPKLAPESKEEPEEKADEPAEELPFNARNDCGGHQGPEVL